MDGVAPAQASSLLQQNSNAGEVLPLPEPVAAAVDAGITVSMIQPGANSASVPPGLEGPEAGNSQPGEAGSSRDPEALQQL